MATALESLPVVALPELIPVRMLNEFTYCPRLAYIEWVDQEFEDNLDTMEGRFAHRRVDRESKKDLKPQEELPEKEKIHTRSVMLSAPSEGLVAKLDLVETVGDVATPVDYKRGKVPDVPGGAWEPERVQLCAQGLILRENGFQSDKGYLYYAESRRRVEIEFDETLIRRTRELAAEFRRVAEAGLIPPPLIDSPKCPRCSLVGICLPDEINLLTHRGEVDHVRKLLPTRDNAMPVYVQEQGARVGKSKDRLVVKSGDKVVQEDRLMDVSQLCVFGNVQVSTQALHELVDRETPVCYFSYGGYFKGMTTGLCHKNVELRIRQYDTARDRARSLALARAMIAGKIKNCRTLVRRDSESLPPATLERLNEFQSDAERAQSVETLLGVEGMAAKWYFAALATRLKGMDEFKLDGRNRRPPTDPVNAMLSFAYALLTKELTVALQAVGFDPMLGFLHQPRYGRPSLALDLAEEFRPLIADSVVLTLVNNAEIKTSHFTRRGDAVALDGDGRKIVLGAYERRMDTEVTHPIFGYRVCYRRVLEVQARLLSRVVRGELPEYVPFVTR